jgi:hypothetical protein
MLGRDALQKQRVHGSSCCLWACEPARHHSDSP